MQVSSLWLLYVVTLTLLGGALWAAWQQERNGRFPSTVLLLTLLLWLWTTVAAFVFKQPTLSTLSSYIIIILLVGLLRGSQVLFATASLTTLLVFFMEYIPVIYSTNLSNLSPPLPVAIELLLKLSMVSTFLYTIINHLRQKTEQATPRGDALSRLQKEIVIRQKAEETLRHANQRLQVMKAVERALLAAKSPAAIGEAALEHLHKLVPFDRASVSMFDYDTQEGYILTVKAENAELAQFMQERQPFSDLHSLPLLQAGEPYWIENIATLDNPSATDKRLLAKGLHAYICVPILTQKELVGALNIHAVKPGQFSIEHQAVIQEVATAMSVVMQQAQLRQQLEQYTENLEHLIEERTTALTHTNHTLRQEIAERHALEKQIQDSLIRRTDQVAISTEVAQRIAVAPALDELFYRVVHLVQARFGYYHAHVYTLEPDQNLVMQEGTGKAAQQMKAANHKILLSATKSVVAQAARTGQPVLVPDVSQNPQWLDNPLLPETRSEIAVPIKLEDETIGVLDVQHDQVNALNEEDELLLIGLCGQIAAAIHNRRLEAKRQQAETAIRAYAAELEQNNRELRRFAEVASHDLQEPLRKIQTFGDRLAYKYSHLLDSSGADYLGRMQQSAAQMQNLLNDLIKFTEVITRGQPFTAVNLNEIIKQVQVDLETRIKAQQADINVTPLPTIEADPFQMYQLFQGLLSNALKFYNPEKPLRIHVTSELASDQLYRINITDNGIGLDEKYLDRIFDAFERLHNRDAYEGTGIGLAVCRKVVERHMGTITAKSQPGKGSTFIVTLPATHPSSTSLST